MGVLVDFYWIVFIKENILTFRQIPEIWRLATAFFITGPKLGMILDPYFLYTYSSGLETTSSSMSAPGDYFMYLIFVCTVIIVSIHHTSHEPSRHEFSCSYKPHISARTVLFKLSRFLELREIAPVLHSIYHSQYYRGVCGVQAWWDSILRKLSALKSNG